MSFAACGWGPLLPCRWLDQHTHCSFRTSSTRPSATADDVVVRQVADHCNWHVLPVLAVGQLGPGLHEVLDGHLVFSAGFHPDRLIPPVRDILVKHLPQLPHVFGHRERVVVVGEVHLKAVADLHQVGGQLQHFLPNDGHRLQVLGSDHSRDKLSDGHEVGELVTRSPSGQKAGSLVELLRDNIGEQIALR